MTDSLSVIVPVRNRSGIRLENCLRSLRWQSVDPSRIEIVLSDFGSEGEHAESIRELAGRYDAVVEHTRTDEVWNRSRALNVGIQRATRPFVLCTDADMIFAPSFVPTLLDVHATTRRPALVHCACNDLPEDVPERLWDRDDYADLEVRSERRPALGTGACACASRGFFFRVRGYDEKYVYWGSEDVDLTSRAQRAGLAIVWVSDRTTMLHQWHPKMKDDRKLQFHLNRWRYRLTRRRVVKNPTGWGKLVSASKLTRG